MQQQANEKDKRKTLINIKKIEYFFHFFGTRQGNQIDVVGYLSGAGTCSLGYCLITRTQAFIALLLTTGQFILNLIISNGTSANIAANFISSKCLNC